jgi:hypothetical protein
MNAKIILYVFYFSSILVSIIALIFFNRAYPWIILLLMIFCITVFFTVTIGLTSVARGDRKKTIVLLASFTIVIIYIACYGFIIDCNDHLFFKSREERLNEFVKEINDYEKIYEMNNGLQSTKILNNKFIEFENINNESLDRIKTLDEVLISEGIERHVYENFRQKLIDISFIEFEILEDGTIMFTIGGFLNSCDGIAYSITGESPKNTRCGGRLHHWKHLNDYWYFWYS